MRYFMIIKIQIAPYPEYSATGQYMKFPSPSSVHRNSLRPSSVARGLLCPLMNKTKRVSWAAQGDGRLRFPVNGCERRQCGIRQLDQRNISLCGDFTREIISRPRGGLYVGQTRSVGRLDALEKLRFAGASAHHFPSFTLVCLIRPGLGAAPRYSRWHEYRRQVRVL